MCILHLNTLDLNNVSPEEGGAQINQTVWSMPSLLITNKAWTKTLRNIYFHSKFLYHTQIKATLMIMVLYPIIFFLFFIIIGWEGRLVLTGLCDKSLQSHPGRL